MAKQRDWEAEIRTAVREHFINSGEYPTAQEIADAIGASPSSVRKYADDVCGIVRQHQDRTTYSRDYPSMEHGVVRIVVYAPTMDEMRQMVIEERSNRGPGR